MASGQQQTQQNQGSTFFSDPGMIQRLLDSMGGQQGQFNDYLSNPTASPLYTNQLRGLMASLQPQEAASRQAYNDAGVAAGNRSSGAFAQGGANLEGNIMRNQQSTAGQLLGQNFSQMTQALLSAMGLTPQMMNALKLQQNSGSGQSSGWNDAGGGSTGTYGQSLASGSGNYQAGSPFDASGQQRSMGGSASVGPNYNPAEHAGWQQTIAAGQPANSTWFGGGSGNFVSGAGQGQQPFNPGGQDQFGFTPQDWASDPYMQN